MAAHDPVAGLEVYVVGGAVRDALLERPCGDRDWVVVGTTPEAMAERGFIPVGGDFPVFLHPHTKEEYALARTERKSGRGYRGFTFHTGPEVTLEQDLQRRDLTVNAMAQAPDGRLIDPCNGRADLAARVLRHVGEAFLEDPVRILRLARFAARFDDFSVAPDTQALCRRMVDEGEVDALVPERVWRELARGLMESHPSRMLAVLADAGVLARAVPGLSLAEDAGRVLDEAAAQGLALPVRYALLCDATPDVDGVGRALRAPADCTDHARVLQRLRMGLDNLDVLFAEAPGAMRTSGLPVMLAESVVNLLEATDALRKPQRFVGLLPALALRRPGLEAARWWAWLEAVRGVDAGAVAARQAASDPQGIRQAVHAARVAAVAAG